MNCRVFEQYLNQYLDGDLQGTLKLEFEAHLVNCRSCGHEFATMEAVGQIISCPAPEEPRLGGDFAGRVMAGLSAEKEKTLHFRRRVRQISRAAAIILVATGTATFFLGREGTPAKSPIQVASTGSTMLAMNSNPVEWLAGTLEQAGSNILELKDFRSSALDQIRQGLVSSLTGPVPAAEPESLLKPVTGKDRGPTPLPARSSHSEPELELL